MLRNGSIAAEQLAVAAGKGDADGRLVERVVEQGLGLAQVLARTPKSSVKSVIVPTQPATPSAGTNSCVREVPHGAVGGDGAIAVETAGTRARAKLRPQRLHARPIVGMHAFGPGIRAVPDRKPEHAPVFRVAVGHVADRVGMIDGNRSALDQRLRGNGVAPLGLLVMARAREQREIGDARAQLRVRRNLACEQLERGSLLG